MPICHCCGYTNSICRGTCEHYTYEKNIYIIYIHTHTYIYEIILLVHISKQYVCTMAKYVLGITLSFPIVIGC